jgi:AmiR/NasT family two-component response regulator
MKTVIERDLSITVKVTERDSLENQLDAAVSAVRERATGERRRGILVTRHGVNEFTVALSDSVPFGLTQENHAW